MYLPKRKFKETKKIIYYTFGKLEGKELLQRFINLGGINRFNLQSLKLMGGIWKDHVYYIAPENNVIFYNNLDIVKQVHPDYKFIEI